ncbi:hypothetical protein [Stieleria sp.]|uniref:hypothetical protein n=1 Tax=Stieleria sp. TaxID=2795976 RepID=UPI00356172A3
MAKIEAVPTEYKGVKYKSKSEAMFAKYLEAGPASKPGGGFTYEPKELIVGNYAPDFVVWWLIDDEVSFQRQMFQVIEYKPKKPTNAYTSRFMERASVMRPRLNEMGVARPVFGIFHGSVWNKTSGIIQVDPVRLTTHDTGIDWIKNARQLMQDERYDLVAEAG